MSDITYVARVDRLIEDIEPLALKLQSKGKIPETAHLSTIGKGELASVAALHSTLFPIQAQELERRFTQNRPHTFYSNELSLALKTDKTCIGCSLLLSATGAGSAFLFALILDPAFRRTWATPWLKYQTFKHLYDHGFENLAFEAHLGNDDTIKHARRVGASALMTPPAWCR